jgi:hypothetical protein
MLQLISQSCFDWKWEIFLAVVTQVCHFWAKVLVGCDCHDPEPGTHRVATDDCKFFRGPRVIMCSKYFALVLFLFCDLLHNMTIAFNDYIKPSKSLISLFIFLNTVLVWFSTNLSLL